MPILFPEEFAQNEESVISFHSFVSLAIFPYSAWTENKSIIRLDTLSYCYSQGSDEDSVDFAPPSIESIIHRLRRSIMVGQLFKKDPVIMIG